MRFKTFKQSLRPVVRSIAGLLFILLATASCNRPKEVFLFSTFREPATEGLYLAYSYDGYHWTDLGGSFLQPGVGNDSLMRDPSIVRDRRGRFHLVWTCSWTNDNGFGYAWSDDLVHWSPQKFIPVMQFEPATVNVWAPELYYEEDRDTFLIIWASTIPYRFERGIEEERNNHRLYYTTTRDFETFSETRLFLDPGFSVIDAVVLKRDEKDFVLVLKDNTRPNRNLRVAFGESPLGPWKDISEPLTGQFTEGPTILRKGDQWIIYFDAYREGKYGAVITGDFLNFKDISDEISLPQGHKHGTIFRADRKVLRGLEIRAEELSRELETKENTGE